MNKTDKILITGASGLIGSALVRLLKAEGYENVLTPTHDEIDWTDEWESHYYCNNNKPKYVFHLAAVVGGIKDNFNNPVQFIYHNTLMHCNILSASHQNKVKKLLFPGSACAYPRDAEQPIKESSFLQGMPEPTNLAYAVAKINGIIMAQSYAKQYGMNVVLPMVANTYGIGDRSSHVIPQMIRKFREIKDEILFFGAGTPIREFIYADDAAEAFLFLMKYYVKPDIINIGTQDEISIRDLAYKIANIIEYKGNIVFDNISSDGALKKVLDCSIIRNSQVSFLDGTWKKWKPKISLDEGLRRVIASL